MWKPDYAKVRNGAGWYCLHHGGRPPGWPPGTSSHVPAAIHENYPDQGTAILMCDILNARDYPDGTD